MRDFSDARLQIDTKTGLKADLPAWEQFVGPDSRVSVPTRIAGIEQELATGSGPGADFLGWVDWPHKIDASELAALERSAVKARRDCEVYVVIGIGGSYLGARAILEALGRESRAPEIVFAGNSLCPVALDRVMRRLRDRQMRLCVISKSGTTLEPAVAFRVLRAMMLERYGPDESARRITVVTDAHEGVLRRMAEFSGYEAFAIPPDIGGRFSVLTPVGLLPLAVAGIDVRALCAGAEQMRKACIELPFHDNACQQYAAVRYGLYSSGYRMEILSAFDSRLFWFQEWWKQLFGESEGKDGHGIFPAAVQFTTDLHSLGQYIQDGRRDLFETFLLIRHTDRSLNVPASSEPDADLDGLGYLTGMPIAEINQVAAAGTHRAHASGGVPCLTIELDRLDERALGALVYFFEKAVALSGRLLGVNPFDQPGVEAYKKEMYELLGRPRSRRDG